MPLIQYLCLNLHMCSCDCGEYEGTGGLVLGGNSESCFEQFFFSTETHRYVRTAKKCLVCGRTKIEQLQLLLDVVSPESSGEVLVSEIFSKFPTDKIDYGNRKLNQLQALLAVSTTENPGAVTIVEKFEKTPADGITKAIEKIESLYAFKDSRCE